MRTIELKPGVAFAAFVVVGFVFAVLFPGFMTLAAPVSWVKFQRNSERVIARAQVCVFFFVPYKTMTVDPVIEIGNRSIAGTVSRARRPGGERVSKSESEGFLVIRGDDQIAEVPVSPFNLKSVRQRAEEFLKNQQATEMKLFVVANWKFGIVAAGCLSLLTLAYVLIIVLVSGGWIFRRGRRLLGFATGAESREGHGHSPPKE